MQTQNIPAVKKIALCVVVVSILIGYVYLIFDVKETLVKGAEYALEEVIEKDFQKREFKELKHAGEKLGRNVKGVTIVTENGEEVFEFKDSMDERTVHRLATQYLLAKIHPIHPDTLNGMLQNSLKKYGLTISSGIVYSYNEQKQYSNNDTLALHRPFLYWCRQHTLDIKGTVGVQAWVNINPWRLLQNLHSGAFWSLLLFGIVASWMILTPWGEKDSSKAKFGNMLFDKIGRKVTIDGKECKLRYQEFQLLLMFVEKYNHALSRDEIKRSLWNDESGTENRLSNLLSTLRNALKDYPEYQIMVDEEKGYILKIRKHTTDGYES